MTNSIPSVLRQSILWICSALIFASCDKKPDQDNSTTAVADSNATGIFICNEGNFQWGNSTLSFYNTANATLYPDIQKSVNGKATGDVLQSVCNYNGKLYLVLNNSGRIDILDSKTFKFQSSITGLRSPRFILPISSTKAYISDLYDNAISIVDLAENRITGKISCGGWTEEMVRVGNIVYVCNRYRNYVYCISTTTDELTDSIETGYGPMSICLDKNGKIWTLTEGKDQNEAALICINPSNRSLEKKFNLGASAKPMHLITDPGGINLYWINAGLYKMNVESSSLPTGVFAEEGTMNFYGLGFDKNTGLLLASDAKDYIQKSEILGYDQNGAVQLRFKAGINSSYFLSR